VYHYDLAGNLIAETDSDGNLIRDYVWADSVPVAQVEAGEKIAYLHTDHLNTPRLATNAQGNVIWRWEGTAFGESYPNEDVDGNSIKTVINLRFPGQYYDLESGLHYNWNRYYDPKLGRYVTSDPIGLRGGLNTYAYAKSNPLLYVDKDGLLFCTYSITKHALSCVNNSGEVLITSDAKSGRGTCTNNPKCTNLKNVGPLPVALYNIYAPYADPRASLHPNWLFLDRPVNSLSNRDELFIHPYGLSKGCIAVDIIDFNVIYNWAIFDNGGMLVVTE
jgi:RHS repeat-associated protein